MIHIQFTGSYGQIKLGRAVICVHHSHCFGSTTFPTLSSVSGMQWWNGESLDDSLIADIYSHALETDFFLWLTSVCEQVVMY